MRIDFTTWFLGFVAITYIFVGLGAFFDISTIIEDWRIEYAKATTIVGVSCALVLSLRIYEQIKKSRKVKEESDDNS